MSKASPNKLRCGDCLHYEACQSWNVGSLLDTNAEHCANYRESVDEPTQMYVMLVDGKPRWYAYGEPWVATAMYMDDWKYPTKEEAIAAWVRYLEKEGKA